MNVTWTLGFPTGDETGDFLAVDLGGTNLRVCWIELKGRQSKTVVTQEKCPIPPEIKTGNADALWTFVTDSLEEFIAQNDLHREDGEPLPLGFSFSYPAMQEYVDHGVLQTWTKGFDIKGVEGEDVAVQLTDAMKKRVCSTLHLQISRNFSKVGKSNIVSDLRTAISPLHLDRQLDRARTIRCG